MNILNVLDSIGRGGLERQFVELLKGIDKNKFKIFTIVFDVPNISYQEEIKTYLDEGFSAILQECSKIAKTKDTLYDKLGLHEMK